MLDDTKTKICPKCLEDKLLSTAYKKRSGTKSHLYRSWCTACEGKAAWKYQKNNIKKTQVWWKTASLKYMYGMTREQFEQLHDEAEGVCMCCGEMRPLCVDHDHNTGKVRGLLCRTCNGGIGMLGDTKEGIINALEYFMNRDPETIVDWE